eukprot:gene21551-biopygen5675
MSGVGPPAIRPRSTPGGDDQPCYMSGVGPPAMWPRKPPRQEATNYAHEPLVGELQRPRNQHTNPLWGELLYSLAAQLARRRLHSQGGDHCFWPYARQPRTSPPPQRSGGCRAQIRLLTLGQSLFKAGQAGRPAPLSAPHHSVVWCCSSTRVRCYVTPP